MNNMANSKNLSYQVIALSVIALGLIVIGYVLYANNTSPAYAGLDEFAQCLADKKITMYGSATCPHCQKEKRAFGESFKYVPYVECTTNPKACVDAQVEGVPTWIFPDGKRLVGEQGLQKLSAASGCPLPKTN
jgi:protein-disulfide isomerase